MKSIILCADDFGQNHEINEGILALVKKERLSGVSCMTTGPLWQEGGEALKHYLASSPSKNIGVGLHFNLTFGTLFSRPSASLPSWILRTHLRHIPKEEIKRECITQLQAFQNIMGHPPHFIDGHEHIHQLPGIGEILFSLYEEKQIPNTTYVRHCFTEKGPFALKRWILNGVGARQFHEKVQQRKIPHNTSFAGIYDFSPSRNYQQLFQRFCEDSASSGLIMCHPALLSQDETDPIRNARYNEYLYLDSDSFLKDFQGYHQLSCPLGEACLG